MPRRPTHSTCLTFGVWASPERPSRKLGGPFHLPPSLFQVGLARRAPSDVPFLPPFTVLSFPSSARSRPLAGGKKDGTTAIIRDETLDLDLNTQEPTTCAIQESKMPAIQPAANDRSPSMGERRQRETRTRDRRFFACVMKQLLRLAAARIAGMRRLPRGHLQQDMDKNQVLQ